MTKSLDDLRISDTVYSWVMPETEDTVERLKVKGDERKKMRERHREAWTQKQDSYHEEFLNYWANEWASDLVDISRDEFSYAYPANGSSEAIRETLAMHASIEQYRPAQGVPRIHVFKGEYEGYEALAEPYGIEVVYHDRTNWRESLQQFASDHPRTDNDLFYLSQPSSIDGCLWSQQGSVPSDLSSFFDWIESYTDIEVALDLCYVGTVRSEAWGDFQIKASHPVVKYVFFSLSKVFGVYYHRIGGVFSREEIPGLYGNKWFKNLDSLYLGEKMMKEYGPHELPDRYEGLQKEVVDDLNSTKTLGNFYPSDVFLLSRYRGSDDLPNSLRRNRRSIRVCLTQRLYEKAKSSGFYRHE